MTKHDSYPVATCFCLKCGHSFDHASNLTGRAKPVPGDLTLCIGCGHLLRFASDMTVELVDEASELKTMSELTRRKVAMAKLAIELISPLMPKDTEH